MDREKALSETIRDVMTVWPGRMTLGERLAAKIPDVDEVALPMTILQRPIPHEAKTPGIKQVIDCSATIWVRRLSACLSRGNA